MLDQQYKHASERFVPYVIDDVSDFNSIGTLQPGTFTTQFCWHVNMITRPSRVTQVFATSVADRNHPTLAFPVSTCEAVLCHN